MDFNHVGIQAEAVKVSEKDGEKEGATITGLALPLNKVSRNGVQYSEESVRENAETMVGNSVLFNHDVDTVVGHVEDVYVDDEGMHYQMNLDEEHELVRKVERGDINSVSIQAIVEPRKGDTNVVDVKEFLELSLVSVPGFGQTTTNMELTAQPEGVLAMETFKEEFMSGDGVGKKYVDAVEGTVGEAKRKLSDLEDVSWEAAYVVECHNKDRKTLKKFIKEQMVDEQTEWMVQFPAYDVAVETNWDGVDKSEFESNEEFRSVHVLVKEADEALPVAHREDDQLKLVYEGLNSAFDTVERVDNVSDKQVSQVKGLLEALRIREFSDRPSLDADQSDEDEDESDVVGEPFAGYDDFQDCVDKNSDKRDPEAYCAAIQRNVEEDDNDVEEDTMGQEQMDDLMESDLFEVIAAHYEELDVEEVAKLYEDFEFAGFDLEVVAGVLGKAYDVPAEDVIGMLEEFAGDDEEEEPEEEPMDEPEADDEDKEESVDEDDEDDVEEVEESVDEDDDSTETGDEDAEESVELEEVEDADSKEEMIDQLVERIEKLEEKLEDEEDDGEDEAVESHQISSDAKEGVSFADKIPRINGRR